MHKTPARVLPRVTGSRLDTRNWLNVTCASSGMHHRDLTVNMPHLLCATSHKALFVHMQACGCSCSCCSDLQPLAMTAWYCALEGAPLLIQSYLHAMACMSCRLKRYQLHVQQWLTLAPSTIPMVTKNMFAMLCSSPIDTNAVTGSHAPEI